MWLKTMLILGNGNKQGKASGPKDAVLWEDYTQELQENISTHSFGQLTGNFECFHWLTMNLSSTLTHTH